MYIFLIHLFNFCIQEEFTEILNIETVVKEDEVKEELVDKGIQREFLHILQELYIITGVYIFLFGQITFWGKKLLKGDEKSGENSYFFPKS